jgi:DNA-binding transcriptional LysR family regulator
MAAEHPLAGMDEVPVGALDGHDLLLPSEDDAGEWVDFVRAFCRQAGVVPRRWPGVTHGSVSAADVVRQGECVVPTAAWAEPPEGIVFRPLVDPVPLFPWSLMWLTEAERRAEVATFLDAARAVAAEEGWAEEARA